MYGCNGCRICPRFIVSAGVTFAAGVLTINLPAGSYEAGKQYCILINQPLPAETTVAAEVAITIGTGTEVYEVTNKCCAPVSACNIKYRGLYKAVVVTSASGGSFRLLNISGCKPLDNLTAIDGTAPEAATGGDGA